MNDPTQTTPAPDWWEQQVYHLVRRERQLDEQLVANP